jgi:hypothetical protein
MSRTPPEPESTRCGVCGRSLSQKTAGLVKNGCIFCEGETDG